jgi:hypothetical protein
VVMIALDQAPKTQMKMWSTIFKQLKQKRNSVVHEPVFPQKHLEVGTKKRNSKLRSIPKAIKLKTLLNNDLNKPLCLIL